MKMSFGVVPARVGSQNADRAGRLLAETGAVILTGLEPTPDALAVAAALALGHRLRQVFPYRSRPSRDSGPVHLGSGARARFGDLLPSPQRANAASRFGGTCASLRLPGPNAEISSTRSNALAI
ncbi:hypothetical protein [Nonomuraea dietziae]|uniref:Uncharacterized protein n=1 Tax=Nonomuraea dietziae TaxID=65515 RepID=A0A7W5Y5D7_9ACTN|nr:hypothetical protein [Nonomuraea dietziae]MBB3725196.1 hypothetical protein [Nonomuraea dietziae]